MDADKGQPMGEFDGGQYGAETARLGEQVKGLDQRLGRVEETLDRGFESVHNRINRLGEQVAGATGHTSGISGGIALAISIVTMVFLVVTNIA